MGVSSLSCKLRNLGVYGRYLLSVLMHLRESGIFQATMHPINAIDASRANKAGYPARASSQPPAMVSRVRGAAIVFRRPISVARTFSLATSSV